MSPSGRGRMRLVKSSAGLVAGPVLLLAIATCGDFGAVVGGRDEGMPNPGDLVVWRGGGAGAAARAVVTPDRVFVHSVLTHSVSALDRASGTLRWKTQLPLTSQVTGGRGLSLVGERLVVG